MTHKLSLLSCIVIIMFICSCNVSDSAIAKNGDAMPITRPDTVKPLTSIHGVYISKYIQNKVAENSKGNIATSTYSRYGSTSDCSTTNLAVNVPGVYISRYIKKRLIENKDSSILTFSGQSDN